MVWGFTILLQYGIISFENNRFEDLLRFINSTRRWSYTLYPTVKNREFTGSLEINENKPIFKLDTGERTMFTKHEPYSASLARKLIINMFKMWRKTKPHLRWRNWTSRPHRHYRRHRHVILLWCHRRSLWRHQIWWYPPFLENGYVFSCHGSVTHIFVVLGLLLWHLWWLGRLGRLLKNNKYNKINSNTTIIKKCR